MSAPEPPATPQAVAAHDLAIARRAQWPAAWITFGSLVSAAFVAFAHTQPGAGDMSPHEARRMRPTLIVVVSGAAAGKTFPRFNACRVRVACQSIKD